MSVMRPQPRTGRQNPLLPESAAERPLVFPTAGMIVVEHHTTPTPTALCTPAQGWSEVRGQPWVPCQTRIQPHRGCAPPRTPQHRKSAAVPAKPRRRTATAARSLPTPRLRVEPVHLPPPTMHCAPAEAQRRREARPLSFPPAFLRVFASSRETKSSPSRLRVRSLTHLKSLDHKIPKISPRT
jgi:hypothetical protein